MAAKKVAWNETTKTATVLLAATAIPGGSVLAGNYTHPDPTDELSVNQYSHVTFQHVQDIMYRFNGWQDMQALTIVDNTTVKADGLTVSPNTLQVGAGSLTQLTPTVTPSGADDKRVTYSSDNALVAEVNHRGVVMATGVGETNIHVRTADGSNILATVPVEVLVDVVKVTGITLAPTTVSIAVAATQQLTATVAPSDATNKELTWTSSDPTKATVSSSGLVTGVAAGTATITATAKDGSGVVGTKSVTVTA